MTVKFMFLMKPWHENKFIEKYGMPIPKNSLKLYPNLFYLCVCHLVDFIGKLHNQYIHNSQRWCKWHSLTLWNLSLHFYVSSHKTLLIIKHVYSYFHSISNKSFCGCDKRIIRASSTCSLNDLFTWNVGLTIYKITNFLMCYSL